MNKIFDFFKTLKGGKYTVPAVLIVIALTVALFSRGHTEKTDTKEGNAAYGVLSDQLEKRVCQLCEKVDGVGNVYVMLTLDTSQEYVYAENTENNGGGVKSQFVTVNGEGIELYVICPRVRGVAVVCDGGDRGVIRNTLSDLISKALGIPVSSISIAGT